MDKKTPLYECHVAAKGKIVPFAGYLLPVQYSTGVINEHMTVREKVGMFDVSHMAEIVMSGDDALKNIQNLVTNDCSNLLDNHIKYSPMCYENGTVVDDLLIYRIDGTTFLLVVNAANHEKDFEWIQKNVKGDVVVKDISDDVAQIALQGPKSLEVLKKICNESELPEKYYTFTKEMNVDGKPCLISQTGYTGEFGYEIYCSSKDVVHIWNALLKNGEEQGLIPCGLGSRDTLRFEAGMPLYGHEMNDTIMPREAGLGFAVKMKKEDFIGKKAMEEKGAITRKVAGLKVIGKGIARENQDIYIDDKKVGFTTSGTHCPYIGGAYANAMLDLPYNEIGTKVEIDIRGRHVIAEVVKTPFYKANK